MIVLGITKVKDTGEYKIYWKENGRYDEAKAYYTDDLEDAKSTFIDILFRAQQAGYDVRVAGDKFIPDMFRRSFK